MYKAKSSQHALRKLKEGRHLLGQYRQIEELVGDQNPGPVAPPRRRREQRKYQGRSDGEEWGWQGHLRGGQKK